MNKTGDHENYHARIINNNISNFTDRLINKNCLFVDADCSAIAVRIRTKETHAIWPTNKTNILMFSSKASPRFKNDEEIKYHWHKVVNATYG